MSNQEKAPGTLAMAAAGFTTADGLIAAAADLSAWCFKLNGHGGLVYDEQADFYQKGELGQFLVERLRDQYVRILGIATNAAMQPDIMALNDRVNAASAQLEVLYQTARPKSKAIHATSVAAAGALDALDNFYDSLLT